ncbi:MAG: hypothetical protein WBC05_10360, partial [Sedimentisphaerales bacterium]
KLQVSKLSKIQFEDVFYTLSLFCKANYWIFLYSIAEYEVGILIDGIFQERFDADSYDTGQNRAGKGARTGLF